MLHRLDHELLADSTHTLDRRRRVSASVVALASTALLAVASGWSAAPARADGDPASDVLASQSLFLPADGGIPAAQQAQLAALLRSTRRNGYPIRLALIATRADLGSVTELWRQPQSYAGFLGQELSLIYHGTLLVVMPNGFGVDRSGMPLGADQTALDGARTPGAGASLGAAALTAVQRLAGAAGHRLTLTDSPAPPASSSGAGSGSTGPEGWLAFILGAALIALAWTASLRARPARLPRRRHNRVA
jgi:hypothetical protein